MIAFCNLIIRYSFYALFFFVPLVFLSDTSELFELNKIWLTYSLTILIGAAWITKMLWQKQLKIRRTPLDIPILLFLLSQIVSTIFSLDPHISFWGYYSRFNGGLLSTITYVFLYYAFITNVEKKYVFHVLIAVLSSAVVVALWGLPSHFGYDPTCLLFRGTFDVSCWTAAFQPKIRIFSTLGQPDWLAAYLVALLPITIALGIEASRKRRLLLTTCYLLLATLFYADVRYTDSRSGFVAMWFAIIFFFAWYLFSKRKSFSLKKEWFFPATIGAFLVLTFFISAPFAQVVPFTLRGIQERLANTTQTTAPSPSLKQATPQTAPPPVQELGGTDSGKIRLYVWKGAIDIFLHNPLFGSGVETFAFAYYKYRPAGHNLTSEWDYLYNKAHNEYLNYLATTGIFGLGTMIAFLGLFIWLAGKQLWKTNEKNYEPATMNHELLTAAFLVSFLTIIITNFLGFSVVIMNIFLFLFPALVFLLDDLLPQSAIVFPKNISDNTEVGVLQWIGAAVLVLVACYGYFILFRYWQADKQYSLGYNLDHAGEFQTAYQYLHKGIIMRPGEPTFQDELAINDAILGVAFVSQNDATDAAQLIKESVLVNNNLVASHPNVVTYWKSRVRIFYQLSQFSPQYLQPALQAVQKASELAPTDAKISYNLGLIYGQMGDLDTAIGTLHKTISLKPDYRDAYFALGIFYHAKAVNKNNKVVDVAAEKNAVDAMHYIFQNLNPQDTQVKDTLKSWGEE